MRDLASEFSGRGEAGAVVDGHQVVVDCFGDADEALVAVVCPRPLGERVDGVHGVVAADVEHDVDAVGVHDIDEAFEIGVVASLEFVAAGPECG